MEHVELYAFFNIAPKGFDPLAQDSTRSNLLTRSFVGLHAIPDPDPSHGLITAGTGCQVLPSGFDM